MKRIISLIVMVSVCAMVMCSCSTASATDVAGTFLDSIKSGDSDAMKKVYSGEEFNGVELVLGEDASEVILGDDDMKAAIMSKYQDFDYEIIEENVDGDKATVKVAITTYPMGEEAVKTIAEVIVEAAKGAIIGDDEAAVAEACKKAVVDNFNGLEEKSYKKEATLSLTKVDGKWMVDDVSENSDFIEAVTGGMKTASDSADYDEIEDAMDAMEVSM